MQCSQHSTQKRDVNIKTQQNMTAKHTHAFLTRLHIDSITMWTIRNNLTHTGSRNSE